jgi:hypothetical protein
VGPFGSRWRRAVWRERGATAKTDRAVAEALAWLAAHQSRDGGWECESFYRWCDGKETPRERWPDGLGDPAHDVGVTGLALCAFLGAGFTHRGAHPYARTVDRALRRLREVQDGEGCFGTRQTAKFVYGHAIASLAVVEAYGMTEDEALRAPAQRGLDFVAKSRNPYFAWRYGVKPGDNDSSVTGWMMLPLWSARLVNQDASARGRPVPLNVDLDTFEGLQNWFDKITDPDYGRVGYQQRGSGPDRPADLRDRFPAQQSESLTGVGVLARVILGEDPRASEMIQKGARLVAQARPYWSSDGSWIDFIHWHFGTLAMFQVGGKPWQAWNKALQEALLASQRADTDPCRYRGSWDPIDPWSREGGRVYSTAILALCLEVYGRYERVFPAK